MTNEYRAAAIREIFSQRLKLLHARRHISSRALSELCGLDKDAVLRYERSERSPGPEALCALADFFGISTDYLLGRTDHAEQ